MKKEFKNKFNLKINLHNEVGRQFMQNQKMYDGLRECLVIYSRSETIGASEGKSEGEVKKAKIRLRNRYRLHSKIFGYEHMIQELYQLFKYEIQHIISICVKRYLKKWNKNTLRAPSTKSKFKHSATMDRKLAKPKYTNIDDTNIELDCDMSMFD
eukprot:111164_1